MAGTGSGDGNGVGALGVPGLNFSTLGGGNGGRLRPTVSGSGSLGVPGLNFAPLSDAQYQAQYGHIGRIPTAPAPTPTTPTGPIFRPASSLTPQERADVASNYRAQRRQERMFGGNR